MYGLKRRVAETKGGEGGSRGGCRVCRVEEEMSKRRMKRKNIL